MQCPVHGDSCSFYVPPSGSYSSTLAVIGEAPGNEEIKAGSPFVGVSGRLLWNELLKHGVSRDACFVYNAVPCLGGPPRTPTAKEVRQWRDHLISVLEKTSVKCVMMMGAVAARALLDRPVSIEKEHGTVHKLRIGDREVDCVVCYHPAAVIRMSRHLSSFQADIRAGVDVWKGKDRSVPDFPGYEIVANEFDFEHVVKRAGQVGRVSIDVEVSNGGNIWMGGKLYWIGIYVPGDPVYSIRAYDSSVIEAISPYFRKLFETTVVRVGHNVSYDYQVLRYYGLVDREQYFTDDTYLAAHLLYAGRTSSLSLKELARSVVGVEPYWLEDVAQGLTVQKVVYSDASLLSDYQIAKYNAMDCFVSWRLYESLMTELAKDEKLLKVYRRIVMPASFVLSDIQWNGLPVDEESLDRYEAYCKSTLEAVSAALDEIAGRDGKKVNWGSPKQVSEYLFGYLKLPVVNKTDTGVPSTSDDSLRVIRGTHEVIDKLLEYRAWSKRLMVIKSVRSNLSPVDGRVHARINIAGTVSGRSSTSDPNIQNFERGPGIRDIVKARRGFKLVEVDFSQIELRWMAEVYDEKVLKEAMVSGLDVHRKTAAIALGKDESEISSEERTLGKTANFSLGYGAGPGKLANILRQDDLVTPESARNILLSSGVSSDQIGPDPVLTLARKLHDAFHTQFPGVVRAHTRISRYFSSMGYVRSPFGRVFRYVPGVPEDHAKREAANFVVQSPAADTMWICLPAILKVADAIGAKLVNVVHDSVLAEVPEERVDEYLREVFKITTSPPFSDYGVKMEVPISVEAKYGDSWGSLSPYLLHPTSPGGGEKVALESPPVSTLSGGGTAVAVAAKSTLEYALEYLSRGWSVIPIDPEGKTPYVEWSRYQVERPSVAEVKGWFSWDEMNIGVVTGKVSGIVVVDVDASRGGLDTMASLSLQSNYMVRTGGGGIHLYYAYPESVSKVKNTVDIFPGVDIRGDGGYVVAPPSLHQSGVRYEWISYGTNGVSPLPPAILDKIVAKAQDSPKEPPNPLGSKVLPLDVADKVVGELAPFWTEGKRHSLSLAIAGLLSKRGYRWQDVEYVLNKLMDVSGDKEEEDRKRVIVDTYNKVYSGDIVAGHQMLSSLVGSEVATRVSSLVGTYRKIASIECCALGEFIDTVPVEPEWVIEGILPVMGLAQLAGHPGSGKSTLAIQLSACIASGSKFLLWDIPKKRKVLYLQADNPITMVRYLVDEAIKRCPDSKWGVFLANFVEPVRIDSDAGFEIITQLCDIYKPEVVIFDTIRDFHVSDEIDPNAVAAVVDSLKKLRSKCNVSVLYIHHVAKSTGFKRAAIEAHLGSMRWVHPVDLGLLLTTPEDDDSESADLVKLTFAKVRWGKKPAPVWLVRNGRWFEIEHG